MIINHSLSSIAEWLGQVFRTDIIPKIVDWMSLSYIHLGAIVGEWEF